MIAAIVLILALGALLLAGRTGHPKLQELKEWSYAHRGLHGAGRPENSLAAFRAAIDHGFGAELDIHLLRDGNLAVIHDSLLRRTTGREGRIEDLTLEELREYPLEGTAETIPSFREVLDLFRGRTPLIIELKPVDGNHAALAEAACAMMEGYEGLWCMESFDPRCVAWLKKHRPQVVRGQLTEDFLSGKNDLSPLLRFLLTHNLVNLMARPDFIAYNFSHRKRTLTNFLCRRLLGIQGVAWTIRSREDYDTAVKEGWIPIFENFIP